MKPSRLQHKPSLNIVIYAQSGILAGDLAALLSGNNTVNRQTTMTGVFKALGEETDLLLLVSDGAGKPLPDPADILEMANRCHCKVIILGDWPGAWQKKTGKNIPGSITAFSDIPTPAALFEIIGKTAKESD